MRPTEITEEKSLQIMDTELDEAIYEAVVDNSPRNVGNKQKKQEGSFQQKANEKIRQRSKDKTSRHAMC